MGIHSLTFENPHLQKIAVEKKGSRPPLYALHHLIVWVDGTVLQALIPLTKIESTWPNKTK